MKIERVDFGKDDAKGDANLSKYFVDTPEFKRVKAGEALFVIGRKGTGKTAVCEMIQQQITPGKFTKLLSFKNAPIAQFYASNDKEFRAPNQYVSMWRMLIAVEAAKLVLKDQSIRPEDRTLLEDFLKENFGNLDVAIFDVVRRVTSKGVELTLPESWGKFGVKASSDKSDAHTLHFGRAADALLQVLKGIKTKNQFFLLFDELDEDYAINDTYFQLLISLFKAAYQVRLETKEDIRIIPVVVLREDIFSQLEDHDFNKFEDYIARLHWSTDIQHHSPLSLRRLINERIRASFKLSDATNLWSTIADDAGWGGPTADMWSYLSARTMDRPRDIIRFLKFAQENAGGERITAESIDKAEREYSQWLQSEIGNEIFRVLPEYKHAFGILTRIGKGKFSYAEWVSEFNRVKQLARPYKASHVLRVLFEFSVVGMQKDTRWLFKFKTPGLTFAPKGTFIVHYGLMRSLVIPSERPRAKDKREL